MTETPEHRLKRLRMRSMRRGIKEMDVILDAYALDRLDSMTDTRLQEYDALLSENDHDILQWITGQLPPPAPFWDLVADIARHAGSSGPATKKIEV